MRVRHLGHDREAEASAGRCLAGGALEALEDACAICRRDAGAVVDDANGRIAGLGLGLGLTRFRGHPEAFTRGTPDAQDASAVFA